MLQGRSVAVSVVSTLRVSSESMASKQTIFSTILGIGTLKHVILIIYSSRADWLGVPHWSPFSWQLCHYHHMKFELRDEDTFQILLQMTCYAKPGNQSTFQR